MMRLLGSVLVLGATLWFGAYFAAKEKYRLQELAELERAILLLQSQIAYLSAPLTEVLESISWKAISIMWCRPWRGFGGRKVFAGWIMPIKRTFSGSP